MSKRTKIALIIGVIAAVISAAVLIIVFWDKLLEKFPCCKKETLTEEDSAEEILAYTEEEAEAFADLATEE